MTFLCRYDKLALDMAYSPVSAEGEECISSQRRGEGKQSGGAQTRP